MNLDKLPNELFDLLADKTYDELSETEKKQVGQFLTPSEYDDYQLIIKDFKNLDKSLDIQVAETPQLPKKVYALRQILTYKIPVYQVAAGFLVIVAASFVLSMFTKKPTHQREETQLVQPVYEKQLGTSLAEDNYPDSLIFNL